MTKKYHTTHRLLIKTGIRLFADYGFDQVSIEDICKKLHMSRPTFYTHFKTKQHLIFEYFESTSFLTKELINWIHSAPDPWSRLVRLHMANIQHTYYAANSKLVSHYLSFRLLNEKDSTSEKLNDALSEIMLPLISEAQDLGIIANRSDPVYICSSVLLLSSGALFNWCVSGGLIDQNRTFFWNLEVLLSVNEQYRGIWKLDENMPPAGLMDDVFEEFED